MLGRIISWIKRKVKRCADKHCDEPILLDGLCLEHFIAEETAAWDDYAAEVAQAHLVSVGRG